MKTTKREEGRGGARNGAVLLGQHRVGVHAMQAQRHECTQMPMITRATDVIGLWK